MNQELNALIKKYGFRAVKKEFEEIENEMDMEAMMDDDSCQMEEEETVGDFKDNSL